MKTYVNTFIFNEEYSVPMKQEEIFEELYKLGFEEIEIRREYIEDTKSEIPVIAKKARDIGITLYYAIVDTYYKDGSLNREAIDVYFKEAIDLGAKTVKLMPGGFCNMSAEDAAYLRKKSKMGIALLLENGQKSSPEEMKSFASHCELEGIDLGITFDIGNWVWGGQNVLEAAKMLKPWVKAVHLKDGAEIDGKLQVVPIDAGLTDWKSVVRLLRDSRFALEYSCGVPAIENMVKDLNKLKGM